MQTRPSGLLGQVSVSSVLLDDEMMQDDGECAHHSMICRWMPAPQPGWQSGTVIVQLLGAGEHWAEICSQAEIGSLSGFPSGSFVPAGNRLAETFVQLPPAAVAPLGVIDA